MKRSLTITVNGALCSLEVEDADTLLEVLRDRLQLWSVREACGVGACGSCTVLMNGRPVSSCLLLAARLEGRSIETVEGLETEQGLDPIQQAYLENDAAQCGYCIPGFIMATRALLRENPNPTDAEIGDYLGGNLCRCAGYANILRAVRSAQSRTTNHRLSPGMFSRHSG